MYLNGKHLRSLHTVSDETCYFTAFFKSQMIYTTAKLFQDKFLFFPLMDGGIYENFPILI